MRYLVFVFFLIVVILFAHLSDRNTQERVAGQLALATSTALQLDTNGVPRDPRFRDVRYQIAYLDIILEGKVASPEMRDELLKLIREGTPIGRVRDAQILMNQAREPELIARMVPGKVTLEGRLPGREIADRLRRSFRGLGVFVTAQDLVEDKGVNAEDWLNLLDSKVEQFFQGATEGEFVLRGGALQLKRTVSKPAEIARIKEEMSRWLPAGRYQVSVDGLQVAAAVRPVELAIRKEGTRWALSGAVPDRPALNSISRAIEEADASSQVDSTAVTVDGALARPKWLQDGRIERFLKVFVSTVRENPEIIIRADGVVLRGTASDFIARSNLPSFASEAFGYGLEINDEGVRSAPLEPGGREQWLRFDVNPGSMTITGTVPSDQDKRDLAASLARAFPGAELKDAGLVVNPNIPPMPWLQPLGSYFPDLAALTSQKGTIDVSGKKAYLGGMAKSQWSRNALVGKLELVLGPDFAVYDQLLVDPRGESVAATEAIKVYFAQGASQLTPDHQAKIAEATARINQSANQPNLLVLIKGYASPEGSADSNIQLSQERALAVYQALIGRGVNPRVLKILPEGVDPNLSGNEARRVEIFIR